MSSHEELRHLAARASDRLALAAQAEVAFAEAGAVVIEIDALRVPRRTSTEAAPAAPGPVASTFATLTGRSQAWLDPPEQLSKWWPAASGPTGPRAWGSGL